MRSSHLRATLTTLVLLQARSALSCDPLDSSDCAADTALSSSVTIDLTSSSDQFTASGSPTITYDSNGAAFVLKEEGDAPTLDSDWYIMFGHVTYSLKAAPGQGVVSAAILQSDDLDEIDWEFIGSQDTTGQSCYFKEGVNTESDRLGNFTLPSGETTTGDYHTYSVDWTKDRIEWGIDGTIYRTLEASDTDFYPQTPMQIKLGVWAGGDPSNAAGTIAWAGGEINYSDGPYTMYVKEVTATDYSTGTEYSYDGTSGSWESIVSTGGTINGNIDADDSSTSASTAASSTATSSSSSSDIEPFGYDSSSTDTTATGWPWVATSTASATGVSTTVSRTSAASTSSPFPSSSAWSLSSVSSYTGILETVTTYDEQGFLTTEVIDPNAPKSYDSRGFLITSTFPRSAAPEPSSSTLVTVSVTSTTIISATDTTTTSASSSSSSDSVFQENSAASSSATSSASSSSTASSNAAAASVGGSRRVLVNLAQVVVVGGVIGAGGAVIGM